MGIKFRCPQGHKLNVKSFLAGKRGVCPDCGATFRIPPEPGGSDILAVAIPSLKGSNGAEAAAVAVQSQAAAQPAGMGGRPPAPVAAVQAVAATIPAAAPTGIPLPVQPAAMPAMVAAPAVMPAAPVAMPATGVPPAPLPRPPVPPGAAPSDPIAEAPAAIWYVRPPSGGQYGPARGDVMRRWLAEGRVSGDSLVWREGWVDWQSAGKLFPMLGGVSPAAAAPAAAVVTPVAARTAARYSARKKSGSGLAIAALVGLVLVCIVLVVVLVVVLAQQSS
jgi:hypothetical protein